MDNDTSRDPGRPGPRAAAPARELPPGTAPAPAAGPPPPRDVEAAVIAALAADDPARARDLVAAAAIPGRPGSAPVAAARARIALHLGDHEAARAILVAAIEAHPEVAGLRGLMAEALIAAGGAAQARAVLARLGAPPGGSAAQAPAPGPPGPARRTDAS